MILRKRLIPIKKAKFIHKEWGVAYGRRIIKNSKVMYYNNCDKDGLSYWKQVEVEFLKIIREG
jgi:hypothetical protein